MGASDATIFVRFENARIKFRCTRYVLNARLFDSPCWPEIYLPREMEVERFSKVRVIAKSVRASSYEPG